jgi:phosphate transport system substrate-binding protein
MLRHYLVLALFCPFSVLANPSQLPEYEPPERLSGSLSSSGSDTLANLMTLWAETFQKIHPNVSIQVQAAGSSTAPPALSEGTSSLGPMSRRMKDNEIESFERHYGYQPTAIRVAVDAVAVYVNKDNPIGSFTLQQLDEIFSVTLRCGGLNPARSWGDIGLTGHWRNRPIQLYARNSVSGTYGYFKQVALCKGDFRNTVNEQPGSASVVQSIASSLNGIGFSGIGYLTSGVRAVPLRPRRGAQAIAANPESVASGAYPLTRYMYIYVNKKPGQALPELEQEFFRMILSRQGQEIVNKDGYIPVSAQIAVRELQKLQ